MTDLLEIATVTLSAFNAFALLCLLRRLPVVATPSAHVVASDAVVAIESQPSSSSDVRPPIAPPIAPPSAPMLEAPAAATTRYRIAVFDPETGAALVDAFPLEGEDGENDYAVSAAWGEVLHAARGAVGDFRLIDARCRTPRARHVRRATP